MSKADIEKINDFGKKLENYSVRDIFTQAGINSDLAERAIKDYQRYLESDLCFLTLLSGDEIRQIGVKAFIDKAMSKRTGKEIAEKVFRDWLGYLNFKKEIIETYQESKDWEDVYFTSVYSDVDESQEAFIDYVEEVYKTKVKDGKHLQKLTGIKEETLEGLEETVINSRYSKYSRALQKALEGGATYPELLKIKPKEYGLPEKWNKVLVSDQYSSILWALSSEFLIDEPGSLMLLPDLRSIAQEIQAPYSVLMDAYNLTKKGKKYGDTGD